MGYKVNPPSTEELRQMAVQRLGEPAVQDGAGLSGERAKKLLEEVAISKIEVEIQNVYLQDTCARLDVALNELTDIYDFAPVGFISTDATGKISKLNLVAASLLGAERNTLMGRVFVDYLEPGERSRVQALMRRASDSGEDQHCEVSLGGGNRALQHVQLSLSPSYTLQGHHLVLTNITARQAREDDLRAREQCWKSALEATGEGLWEWDLRSDTLRYCPRLAQLYGMPVEQVGSTLDGWRERVHPEDWPAVRHAIQKCLGAEEDHFSSEHRKRASNGHWIWMRCSGAVLGRDENGQAMWLLGTDTDISASKRMEEELLDVGGIQQSVFELLPQYLAVLDAEARVMLTNSVWNAYGLASGHAYRNGFARLAYADLLDAVTGGVEQTKREALAGIADVISGKTPSFQLEYSFVGGAEARWFVMHVLAVQGARARAVVSHQDVTRIKGHSGGH